MAGRASLPVFVRPVLSLLTTGNEVVPHGTVPGPGQVRNSNGPLLGAMAASSGYAVREAAHARDDLELTREAALRLLSSADALVAAGGISLGAHDHVAPALESVGVRFLFREVAIKPGKPFSFGMVGGKPVFCLPGNPVSVFCTFEEFVLPALRRMSGHAAFHRVRFQGRSLFDHTQRIGRSNLLRVRAMREEGGWVLDMPVSSGSGDLMSTSASNAIAICPSDRETVKPGDMLRFSLNQTSLTEAFWE
jgi:molybdopterin molybdotransferase